jgi:hypothetical protein
MDYQALITASMEDDKNRPVDEHPSTKKSRFTDTTISVSFIPQQEEIDATVETYSSRLPFIGS